MIIRCSQNLLKDPRIPPQKAAPVTDYYSPVSDDK